MDAGNPGSSYLWNTGPTTQTITASTAGIFGVGVTDMNGCRGSDSVLVGFHAPTMVNIGPDASICPGATMTFSVVGAFSSYAWSTGATTSSITVSTAGNYDVTATDANGCQDSDTATLALFAAPSVSLGNDAAICPLDSILLDAGPGQSAYLWNSGATTQTIYAQSVGSYQVTITDGNGCQASDTMLLTHLPYPVVQLGSDTIACQGTTLTMDAGNPGSSYLWNSGATTQTVSTTVAGTFAVTVTPAAGCPVADTINVLFSPVPLPTLPASDTACIGDTIILDPGAIVATYLWSTGATTQAILATQPGPYAITVTDTLGCTASDSTTLVFLTPPTVTLGLDTTICQGDSLTLSLSNTGVTFLWSTGSSANAISVGSAGPYSVVVTDPAGCQGSDTMNLGVEAVPTVLLGGDRLICEGDSIPLIAGNPGLSYLWSTGATAATIQASQAGPYAVTVTSLHGCQGVDSMNLLTQALPTVNIGSDTTLCSGDSLLIVNASGLNGTWSTGSTNASIQATQAGWIWLEVTDNLGCQGRDSLLLALQQLPLVTLSGLAPQYCLSDPAAQLIGQPLGGTYSGSISGTGLFTPSIAGSGSHLILYSYTDSIGCSGADSLSTVVVLPPSTAIAGADQFVTTQADLQAAAPTIGSGHWDIGAFPGQFSNTLSPTATAFLEGNATYPFIWITENAPCPVSMDTVWVQFEGMHIPTGFSPNGDGVNDEYVVRGIEAFPNTRLQVLNRWGQVLWTSDNYQNNWSGQGSNGEPLVEDTYYIILEYGDQKVSTYVVLKRGAGE
ncbi:MAG: gliding motility-associated C-terminal domain-containing protein [Bacteroidia bacterium]